MVGNGRLRGILLLRSSLCPSRGPDARRRDVGDIRGADRRMARYHRECTGLWGGGVDGRSYEPKGSGRVDAAEAAGDALNRGKSPPLYHYVNSAAFGDSRL
jgi:hypothetical protein